MVKVRVPASTSNLGSGFDAFGLALQLYLSIEMERSPYGWQILTLGEGAKEIPSNEENLIVKSAKKVFEKLSEPLPGLKMKIENQIPLFRGLGSSGAATIAGLLGAVQLANSGLTNQEILTLANEIEGHPENAASSLLGGLTINCVDKGQVISKKVDVDKNLRAVLLIPDVAISTHDARRALPRTVSHKDAVFNLQRSALLAHAFITRDYEALRVAMQDKLHQPFRKKLMPAYDEFESIAYQNGAIGVCISGSGSTILGLTLGKLGEGKQLQNFWQAKAQELNINAKVLRIGIDNTGVRIIK
ncbi:MAG: homoserine kinase [bacterium]